MQRLIRKQLVRFVTFLELHCLVANSKCAHLERAEVLVGGRIDGADLRYQRKDRDAAG